MADTLTALNASSPSAEKAAFGLPTHVAVGTASTGANTATFTGAANQQWYICKATVSFGATITGACTFTIKDGTTVIFQAEIPTATNPLPINFDFNDRPLHASTGADLLCNLTTPGSIASAISATGFKVQKP